LQCIEAKQYSIYIKFLISVNCHDLIAKKFARKLNVKLLQYYYLSFSSMCVIHFIHFHIVYWFLSGMKINLRLPID